MKKVTINDIAKLANTSKTTVSFYLNQKYDRMSLDTRRKIEQVIRETNYVPSILARSLNDKQTKLIGVLIGDITNTFSNLLVKGAESVAKKRGYQMIMGNSNYSQDDESKYIDSMMRLDVDGFIIQPTSHFRKYTNIMEENGKKLVFFDSQLYEYRNSWVKTNNYDAVYDTMQVCYHEKGYQKFLMITADPNRLSTRIERSQGFVNSVEDLKVPYEQLIIEDNDPDIEKIKAFLRKHTNDLSNVLVFVPNCWALPIVFSAMKELKLKMPQVGLIGFDNIEWSGFSSPTVTTIVQPAYREGQEAMNMLIDQIEGIDNTTNQRILDCEIHWKESTY